MVVGAAVVGDAMLVPWCFVLQWSTYSLLVWLVCCFVAVLDMLIDVSVVNVAVALVKVLVGAPACILIGALMLWQA